MDRSPTGKYIIVIIYRRTVINNNNDNNNDNDNKERKKKRVRSVVIYTVPIRRDKVCRVRIPKGHYGSILIPAAVVVVYRKIPDKNNIKCIYRRGEEKKR